MTVSVPLPGDGDPLTATGIIRWSEPQSANERWYPLGLEWLPLEETSRDRLHRFLYSHAAPQAGRSSAKAARLLRAGPSVRRLTILISVILGMLAGVLGALRTLSIESANRQFERVIAQRNAIIQRLKAQDTSIQHGLEAAQGDIATASGTVSRLNAEATRFQADVQQLSQEVARFQESYGQVLGERKRLIEQALILQQERLLRERQSRGPEALRLAIREAIANRQAAEY